MLCCVCKEKPATVHLTEIEGEKVQKVDLCEACAKAKGVNDSNFALADLLPAPLVSQEAKRAPGVAVELSKYPTAVAAPEFLAAKRTYQQLSGSWLKSRPATN